MVYSPTGRSDFFLVHGFTTVYSSALGRTDTIVFAKLNKPTPAPPASNRIEINKALGSLIEDLQYSPSFRIQDKRFYRLLLKLTGTLIAQTQQKCLTS